MTELNAEQKLFAEQTEGMIVVDAGPGTGKTESIVNRYVNILKKGVAPNDILMVTFTRNAAQEMRTRIFNELMKSCREESKNEVFKTIKNVKSVTFDSLCLDIVLNSSENLSDFFKIKETLTRNARLVENETLNRQYFDNYFARFVKDNGRKYARNGKDPAALLCEKVADVYSVINKLMSMGVIPLNGEWFGNGESVVIGDIEATEQTLMNNKDKVSELRGKARPEKYNLSAFNGKSDDEVISMASNDDRFMLLEFIRDVYFGYIRKSISDNRLTFGMAELFAFAILYSDQQSRSDHSVEYMMVDEFQDTNELQMKICLLLLRKPNLCVVGDWKQGIYGFRYVSKENITKFDDRLKKFSRELNDDDERVCFKMPGALSFELTKNYRSSSLIIGKVFESLKIPATKDDIVQSDLTIKELDAVRNDEYGIYTDFELLSSKDRDDEADTIVKKIIDYKTNSRYKIVEDGKERPVMYKDIAVLCRKGTFCKSVLDKCNSLGIPAFYQGEHEVMSSKEGKLALAWLRYVNNEKDNNGRMAILADLGYSLSAIESMIGENENGSKMPQFLEDQRMLLEKKKRRPNDLLTSIFAFYGLDNDITQSIISILSSAYSGSLLTISDIIRLIEDDISNGTKYDIDASLDREAVTIQTMHKSKGLQYPIVIIGFVDSRTFPDTKGESHTLRFRNLTGIRCMDEYVEKNVDSVVNKYTARSLASDIVMLSSPTDYSEERQLLFVAMSRAKQYLCMTSCDPSEFFKHYGTGKPIGEIPVSSEESGDRRLSVEPVIGQYKQRRFSVSPHDVMQLYENYVSEEVEGKGKDFGIAVHDNAYRMWKGIPLETDVECSKEMDEVSRILASVKDAKTYAEEKCILPINDTSIKGTIDLLAVYDDRIVIHDYKTDQTERNRLAYEFQLSVYAHAAEQFYGKKAECFIDYVSQCKSIPVKILPIDEIERKVHEYHIRVSEGSLTHV